MLLRKPISNQLKCLIVFLRPSVLPSLGSVRQWSDGVFEDVLLNFLMSGRTQNPSLLEVRRFW
jgi:hypothetical protein